MNEKKELKEMSFASLTWQAVKLSNWLFDNLKDEIDLVVCAKCNAVERNGNGKIDNAIQEWFGFTYKGYYVYFELPYFWAFEGARMSAYKIDNNLTSMKDPYYKTNSYSIDFKNPVENKQKLLELLQDPQQINKQQQFIHARTGADIEYITRKRKIEKHIYY